MGNYKWHLHINSSENIIGIYISTVELLNIIDTFHYHYISYNSSVHIL